MIRKFLFTLLLILGLVFPCSVSAQEGEVPEEVISKARVIEILYEGENPDVFDPSVVNQYQVVKIKILDGEDEGDQIIVRHGEQTKLMENQKVKVGEEVVVTRIQKADGDIEYQIIDKYRLNGMLMMGLFFLVLVLLMSGWKGFGSFFGMLASLLVIVKYIVPQILAGQDPLRISIIGCLVILLVSIYLAHGFSKQTTIAVISTFITLVLAGVLSVVFVNVLHLSGFGNEDAYSLQFGQTANINFRGLLLGGMIIGFLGVLDDVTTGISATVFELHKNNPKIKLPELVGSALNVGREHISSLVNTLVLAYAGASLPIFLFIVLNPQNYPLWFIVNSEMIAEEITRTLVGSMGLLFAVPITTLMAAVVVSGKRR